MARVRSPLARTLLVLALLAAAAAAACLVAARWCDAALFAGVALVCAGALRFRADAPEERREDVRRDRPGARSGAAR